MNSCKWYVYTEVPRGYGEREMPGFDARTRRRIEHELDALVARPSQYEQESAFLLQSVGVELSIEHVLSYLVGYMLGVANHLVRSQYQRRPTWAETRELVAMLSRRAHEMREAYRRCTDPVR